MSIYIAIHIPFLSLEHLAASVKRLIALCVAYAFTSGFAFSQDIVSKSVPEEIEVLATAQKLVASSYRWKFEYARLKLDSGSSSLSPADLKLLSKQEIVSRLKEDPEIHSIAGSICVEAASGKFVLEAVETSGNSQKPLQSSEIRWSFDGATYSFLRGLPLRYDSGKVASSTDQQLTYGRIESQLSESDDLSAVLNATGVGFFPNFCPCLHSAECPSSPLMNRQTYLQELVRKYDVRVSVDGTDLVGLTCFVDSGIQERNGKRFKLVSQTSVMFDRSKGGALAWLLLHSSDVFSEAATWTEVVTRECKPGIWLPTLITTVASLSGSGSRIKISDVEINPNSDEVFSRLEMPPGTEVDDRVTGLRYTISGSPAVQTEAVGSSWNLMAEC